jgi:arylsulfatase A-like enzyme
VRNTVVPADMGLIKQCDDQIGRLLAYLEDTGALGDTMIILTSDHGDYLGDHWMGEKDLFHAPSVKVPLIIYAPRESANSARGTTCDALVEAIDVTATIIDASGGEVPEHIVEGRSLLPYLAGRVPAQPRSFAISEYDYSKHPVCIALRTPPRDARLFMVAILEWKLFHAEGGFAPMLFDLLNDPDELCDLGRDPAFVDQRAAMYVHLRTLGPADVPAYHDFGCWDHPSTRPWRRHRRYFGRI